MKYQKIGKNLKGSLNMIIRKAGRVYQLKATSTDSLVVTPAAGCPNATFADPCGAVFTTKANLTDITNPLNPIALGGNVQLTVAMTDKGSPGEFDSISFQALKDGQLWYSSNWTGAATVEQPIGGGNLVVH